MQNYDKALTVAPFLFIRVKNSGRFLDSILL